MAWLTQAEHLLQLTTPLGADELIPLEFSGTEMVSGLFRFNLSMISDDTDIDATQLLGQPVSLKIAGDESDHGDDDEVVRSRYFHGIVTSFNGGAIDNGARHYYATIQPWLALLGYSADCRIFHNKSVVDIARVLFQEFGFNAYEIKNLSKSYAKRDYCTQYRETALNFLNRLFQEEGIFYYFRFEEEKHVLVLADSNNAFKTCQNSAEFDRGSQKTSSITRWQRQKNMYSGKHEQGDYNYQQASASLDTQQKSSAKLRVAGKYGQYDYPGRYQDSGTGQNWSQQRFEAHEVNYDQASGNSNYTTFTAGGKFTLVDPPVDSDEGDYILLGVSHIATDKSYLSSQGGGGQLYSNDFICMPAAVAFRPMVNVQAKPVIHGTQTAMVVGQEGTESYTDEHGRVKVQFHWDRKGEDDEYSSGWVRVAQAWAGQNWGTLFMPRIGQEVVVQFLEGDPDRPLITGSVYNSNNETPYDLPKGQTQSGIKTRSSKKGGAADYNELRFDDKMGSEELFIQAQKDFNQNIKNNLTKSVGNDSIQTIKNNLVLDIGNQGTFEAVQSITLKVGNSALVITANSISLKSADVEIDKT